MVELELAFGVELSADPAGAVAEHRNDLGDYVMAHTRLYSERGEEWAVSVRGVKVLETETGSYAELSVQLYLTPPPGVSTDMFTLDYDAVMHQVVTHWTLVSVRRDWMNGRVYAGAEEDWTQLGVIRVNPANGSVPALEVDLSGGSYWAGFAGMFMLGMHHIAVGTDHLLFLLTLLLPAPLLASAGRWRGYAGVRGASWSIVKIVIAFTVGHSITLVAGGLVGAAIPQQPVELLIAATIMVSALHALRPLFPRREALVAGGFGLIHGTAFSFTLTEMNLSGPQLALSLLGFNLGIELVQLAIIAAVMPSLLVLAQTRAYTVLRAAGALVAGIAALGWLVERTGHANALAATADALLGWGPWLIAGLALAAGLSLIHARIAPGLSRD